MYDRVKEGWKESSKCLAGTDAFWTRSAAGTLLLHSIKDYLSRYAKGALLDAGAGTLSCKHLATPYCESYMSLDHQQTHPDLDYVADIQALPLKDASFQTVLCVEVLEHVPHPWKALSEIRRVLKPGGKLIITVPHIGYLHNEPYDFYRYTKHGLRVLLEEAGFRVLELQPNGGLFSFLQLSFATILVGISASVPLVRPLVRIVHIASNFIAIWLDKKTDSRKIYALHYVAVAEKIS